MIAVAEGELLEALEALEELLAKSEETIVATIGIGAGEYVLLEDDGTGGCTTLVEEEELLDGEDEGSTFGDDGTSEDEGGADEDGIVGEDEVARLDVVALERIEDDIEDDERLDIEELVEAVVVMLEDNCAELDEGLLETNDEVAMFVLLDVDIIALGVEVDGLEVNVAGLDVELDLPVDDEGLEDAIMVWDEEPVEELLIEEEELDEEVEAVRLYPAPTPAPEYVPDAVLKT